MNDFLSNYINKRNKINDEKLKYDFMPSLQEIIERPSHLAGKIIILSIFIMLIILILWASVSKIDVVVGGTGILLPIENISQIKSTSTGKIKNIYVEDGDYVEEGEVLFELDNEYEKLIVKQLEDRAKKLNIENEIYTLLSDDPKAKITLEDYDEEYHDLINIIISENKLYQKQYSTQGLETIKLQYELQIKQKLLNIEEELNNIEKSLKEYNDKIDNMKIVSSINGYISGINVLHKNQYITDNEFLATVVPVNSEYEFKGYISDKNIDLININSKAEIKLNAFNSSDYETISGEVVYVSPTSFFDERLGNIYIIKIKVNKIPDNMQLISGITGMVEVKVKERTVLNYFLEPITRTVKNSLKE